MVNGALVWITILSGLVRLALAILGDMKTDFESLRLRSSTNWVGMKALEEGISTISHHKMRHWAE